MPTPPSDDAMLSLLRLGCLGAVARGCGLDGAGAGLMISAGAMPAARASAALKAAALLSSTGGPLAFLRVDGFLAGAARFFSMPRSAALFVVTSFSIEAASSALGGKPPAKSRPPLQRKSAAARSAKLETASSGFTCEKVFVAPLTVMRRDQSSAIAAAASWGSETPLRSSELGRSTLALCALAAVASWLYLGLPTANVT
mmetsp:Transcript_15690/g.44638  ORF Transcript_15690/g.44638 Transcript_15690/m.44638 type:complete len:200 (-) Transcript_15690:41-640(-)